MLSSNVINCDLQHQDDCKKTAANMIDYASKTFPGQFDKDNKGIWTTHLVPMRGIIRDYQVSDFQLKLAPSYVTEELIKARLDILKRYLSITYYNTSLDLFKKNYFSGIPGTISDLIRKTDSNVSILKAGGDMFLFPNRGMEIYKDIVSKMDANLEAEITKVMGEFKYILAFIIDHSKGACYENKIDNQFSAIVYPLGNNKSTIYLEADKMQFTDIKSLSFSSFSFTVTYKSIINYYSNNYVINTWLEKNTYTGWQSCDGLKLGLNAKAYINPYFFGAFEG